MSVAADRLRRNPASQPRRRGWSQVAVGLFIIVMLAGAGAMTGGPRGDDRVGLLALGFVNLGSGTSTLLLTRSSTISGVPRVVPLVLAVGALVFFLGSLVGRR